MAICAIANIASPALIDCSTPPKRPRRFAAGDHGVARPPAYIATGTVYDVEDGRPINGAVVTVVGQGHFGASTFFIGEGPPQLLGHGTLTVDGTGSTVAPVAIR